MLSVLLLGCSEQPVNTMAPAVNNSAETLAPPSEAKVSAVTESVAPDTAKSASEDHEPIQGTWDYVTLANGPRNSIVFSQDKITFRVRDKTVNRDFRPGQQHAAEAHRPDVCREP